MSGIFGVFNRDGKAVTRGDLDAMHQVFAQWFDDDHGICCDNNVGLGHTMLWNTPESKLESLPVIDGPKGNRLLITADGGAGCCRRSTESGRGQKAVEP